MHARDAVVTVNELPRPAPPARWFARFAAFLLCYLLFVIVFGAWVRVTGSGAGCGDHWPTCHGDLVPRSPSAQTLIEYTHRLTSGVLGVMALALPLWAWRRFPSGHPVRRYSAATLALVLVEAAIGAGLVLRELVAQNASRARAVVVAVHLTNTLLLTACAVLTVAFAQAPAWASARKRRLGAGDALLGFFCLGLMVAAASGAVTALGDTLFPVHSLAGSPEPPADHFLVQLRVLHPLLACGVVALAGAVSWRFARVPECRRWAQAVGILAGTQLVLGGLNIGLSAPGSLQLAHLFLAQLLWMGAVLLWWSWRRSSPAV